MKLIENLIYNTIYFAFICFFKSVTISVYRHKHLQGYLSEFCYRVNCRFFENQMIDHILTACLNTQ